MSLVASHAELSMGNLEESLKIKIIECDRLLEDAKKHLSGKQGANRLFSKIVAEKKFLTKLLKTPHNIKEEHIRSTNLRHLSSVLNCVSLSNNVSEILKPMSFEDEQCNVRQVVIDVLADQGQTWIKVVARNPQSLYLASLGAAGYGKRSLIHQMKDLVTCAKLNPFMYKQPIIKVWFAAGVATKLKNSLKKINVESIGNCVEVEEMFLEDLSSTDESEDENYDDVNVPLDNKSNIPVETCDMHDSSMDSFNSTFWKNKNLLSLSQIPHGSILNLDVSTMIAYVSSLTNGNCHYEFKDAILTEQAARERICPVKPILDELFKGKQLVCCKMAYTDFQEIISTIGGPMECERARNLFKLVKVVNDQISDAATNLSISSRVKTRSRVIFGTGDSLKAITVTANQGFLRACEGQGVNFVSFLHYSRALTELKEASATEI